MTTLITIPGANAFHLPAPGAQPVLLAQGDLVLNLLPAEPPTRPTETVTLAVGPSAFVLAKNSPVQKTKSKNEHPSFVFTPAPRDDGKSIGQVRIDMKDSTNPDAWEATEQACGALQAELKSHDLWEDKMLFVDDEYETGGPVTGPKVGWGETIASNFLWAGNSLASKLTGRAEPVLPTTAPASGAPVSPTYPNQEGQDFKALASSSWHQATIAAQGLGQAAVAVGGALGEQARAAVDSLGTAGGNTHPSGHAATAVAGHDATATYQPPPPSAPSAPAPVDTGAAPSSSFAVSTEPSSPTSPTAATAAAPAPPPSKAAESSPAPPDGYTMTDAEAKK